jgi:hypothetical protein
VKNYLNIDEPAKTDPFVGPERRPRSIADIDVRQAVLEDLALKTLYTSGPFSILELAKQMRLSFEVANELFLRLRSELQCQVTGMSGNVPNISITSQGRARAIELLAQSH